MRLLRALNIRISAIHLNEGHSAFAGLERVRMFREIERLGLDDAIEKVSPALSSPHTRMCLPVMTGLTWIWFVLSWSRCSVRWKWTWIASRTGSGSPRAIGRNLLYDGIGCASQPRINGVSALHGVVSRRMWTGLWPDRPTHEVPIGHITNGCTFPLGSDQNTGRYLTNILVQIG